MNFNLSKKLFLIFFGIIISLIILEIILQLTSLGYQYYTKSGDFTKINSHENLTIVTLGESTSANNGGGTSWPEQLSEILSNNNVSHEIVNLAVPGIFTDKLILSFSKYLVDNEPDIVIAMIGINDQRANHNSFDLDKHYLYRIQNYLISNFKVIKLLYLISNSLSNHIYSIQFVSADLNDFDNVSNLSDIHTSFKLHNYNEYYDKYKIITLKNYYWLYDLSIKYGFDLVLMQYPTRPINLIQNIFSNNSYDNSNLYYISNENNFKEVLLKYSLSEIFIDNFALDFGHCTEFGNELIANNVYSSLDKYDLI